MPRGITEQEVWKACDVLLLEGARPTIERVRQKLGRGSPNTVSPMLETWFKHLGGRIADPGSFSTPPALPDPVHQAARHFWEVAQAEARRDVEERIRNGLAAATVNVEAEKERAAVAEAAAFSANNRATHLQAQIAELQVLLEAERVQHAATAARADATDRQCVALQAEMSQARQAAVAERTRAEETIAAANERAGGAERRAALEIERERTLRTKADRAIESIAKRFEAALKAEVSATEQLNAALARISSLQSAFAQREQELQARVDQHATRVQQLDTELARTQTALSQSTAQDLLFKQIVAHLGTGPGSTAARRPTTAKSRKKAAA